jgi:hypothetical protein
MGMNIKLEKFIKKNISIQDFFVFLLFCIFKAKNWSKLSFVSRIPLKIMLFQSGTESNYFYFSFFPKKQEMPI